MNYTQQLSLNENTRLWNEGMDVLLRCPFYAEAKIIDSLHRLNIEKDKILESAKDDS